MKNILPGSRRITRKGFTLVELIVVISIISILGILGFISLQGYAVKSRNTSRLANLRNVESGLNASLAKGQLLPIPDSAIEITANGSDVVGYQGVFGEKASGNIQFGNYQISSTNSELPIYGVNKGGNFYQLIAFMEGVTTVLPESHALTGNGKIISAGNGGLILLDINGKPPIDTVDIVTTPHEFMAYIQDVGISGTGMILRNITAITSPEKSYARSCNEIQKLGLSRGDGEYILNPSGNYRFKTYCEMSTDGGGWTLIFNMQGVSTFNKNITGSTDSSYYYNSPGTSAAYAFLPLGNDILIEAKDGEIQGLINRPDSKRVDILKGIATPGIAMRDLAIGTENNRLMSPETTWITLHGDLLYQGDFRQSMQSRKLAWNDTENISPGFLLGMAGHGNAAGWPDYSGFMPYSYHWPRFIRIWTR